MMNDPKRDLHLLILLVGTAIVLALLLRIGFRRIGVPALIGYFALGFGLRLAGDHYGFLNAEAEGIFSFLAHIGVIALLFRIGLESHFHKLMQQLRRASVIWFGNVGVSALGGFAVAHYLLGVELIPSLIVATAFTATSVGVSLGTWKEAGALRSEKGDLLLDVAEMDDLSSILFMAVLFELLPDLRSHTWGSMPGGILKTGSVFLVSLVGFAALCFVISQYAESAITRFFSRGKASPLLVVAGIGIMIAALAGLLGFSVAIGAFFAGLVFSRDPQSVKLDASFDSLYEFFTPFFFIGIGLDMDPATIVGGLGIGCVLAVAAILVKVLGAGLPAFFSLGATGAILIGTSMVPRAEIAMVIMQNGLGLGEWAMPGVIFSGMVFTSAITCIFGSLVPQRLLARWPQSEKGGQ